MAAKSKGICELCGARGARLRRATRTYGKGKDLLVVENVPVVSCPTCGESYLTADVLYQIERIKLHRREFSSKRAVAVAAFR